MSTGIRVGITVAWLLVVLLPGAAIAQDKPGSPIDFSLYAHNPVLPRGPEGAWDSGFVAYGKVIYVDGVFHMFYAGGHNLRDGHSSIGYATSPDGFTWTKSPQNPVLDLETEYGIRAAVPVVENDMWILYFTPRQYPGILGGQTILRATASTPNGPWIIDQQAAVERGQPGAWDRLRVVLDDVILTDDGYRLYYTGGAAHPFTPSGIGMALSDDGQTWTRFDDPTTTQMLFGSGDPVLVRHNTHGQWDDYFVWGASVVSGKRGWEMFYSGGQSGPNHEPLLFGIGYAVSEDGLHWERYGSAPALDIDDRAFPDAPWEAWMPSVVVVDDVYYLFYTTFPAGGLDYYDHYSGFPDTSFNYEIGLATGTISDAGAAAP